MFTWPQFPRSLSNSASVLRWVRALLGAQGRPKQSQAAGLSVGMDQLADEIIKTGAKRRCDPTNWITSSSQNQSEITPRDGSN